MWIVFIVDQFYLIKSLKVVKMRFTADYGVSAHMNTVKHLMD